MSERRAGDDLFSSDEKAAFDDIIQNLRKNPNTKEAVKKEEKKKDNNKENENNLNDTAFVLADESLLIPVLNSLPEELFSEKNDNEENKENGKKEKENKEAKKNDKTNS